MKAKNVKVLYFVRNKYGWIKHNEIMTESEYMDLLLEDVVIKRKTWIV